MVFWFVVTAYLPTDPRTPGLLGPEGVAGDWAAVTLVMLARAAGL